MKRLNETNVLVEGPDKGILLLKFAKYPQLFILRKINCHEWIAPVILHYFFKFLTPTTKANDEKCLVRGVLANLSEKSPILEPY